MVIDILKERDEVGIDPEYDKLDSEEKLGEYFYKSIKLFEETNYGRGSIEQSCGNLMVDLLVHDNFVYEKDVDTLADRALVITSVVRAFAKSRRENPDSFVNGFLAETATCISLKKLGFTVLSPTQNEDLHASIDMYALDKNSKDFKTVLSIQVKASSEVDAPFVGNIETDRVQLRGYLDRQVFRDRSRFDQKLDESRDKMLEYLSNRKELFGDNKVIPLLIIIPVGENSSASVVSMRSGRPIQGFERDLYELMMPKIYKEERW